MKTDSQIVANSKYRECLDKLKSGNFHTNKEGIRAVEAQINSTGMDVKFIDVTPIVAAKLLERNGNNRKISRPLVDKYASDMASGNWTPTHQGIAIYDDGTIADGQHRLAAIVKSGVTIRMFCTTGLKPLSGVYIDANRPRSQVDSIKIGGLSDWIGKDEIAIARFIMGDKRPPTQDVVTFCDQNKESIIFGAKIFKQRIRAATSSPVMAAITLAHNAGENEQRLIEFSKVVISSMPESMDDIAAIKFREYVLNGAYKLGGGAMARIDLHLRAQRAIKAFCDRHQITRLHRPEAPIYTMGEPS